MENKPELELIVNSEKPLNIADKKKIQLEIKGKLYNLEVDPSQVEDQSIAIRLFLVPSIIVTFIFYLFFVFRDDRLIPLSGRISVASLIILLGVISGMITFITFFVREKRQKLPHLEKIYWRNFPTIALSFALILTLSLLFIFWVFGRLFVGLYLDIYLASLFAFLVFSVIQFTAINIVLIFSVSLMIKILITVILSGVVIAMITNGEAQWWQDNLSFLGTADAANSWQFNLTLIFSALLLIALIDYLFVTLSECYPKHKGLVILRILMLVMAVSLGLVGYFPADGPGNMPAYHNRAAAMLVYTVIAMIVGIRWFVPDISKEFLTVSISIGATLVVVTLMFVNGIYMTLTGFEIICFFLAFTWLMLLLQNLIQKTNPPIPKYEVIVHDHLNK